MGSPSERIGPIVHAGVVEAAVTATLKEWLPTYLAEACRQHDVTNIATPRSWVTASEYDRWPSNQLPAIIVSAPGTEGDPRADGDRVYRADYELRVSAEIISADARLIGQIYAGAIRVALMQRRSLGDGMRVTDWRGESNATLGPVGTGDRRTRFASQNIFRVTVPNLFTERGALDAPILEDPGDLVEITQYEIEVVKSAIG